MILTRAEVAEPQLIFTPTWWRKGWREVVTTRSTIIAEASSTRPKRAWLPCVYVLLLGDSIRYVGMTKRFDSRMHQHRYAYKRKFDRVWVRQDFGRLNGEEVEALYITGLIPPENKAMPRGMLDGAQASELMARFEGCP